MGLTFPPLMAIIARHAPPGKGGRSLGIYSSIRLLGFASGPILGGRVTELWGHNATFLLSAILLATSLIAVGIWIPDFREARAGHDGKRISTEVPPVFRLLGGAIFLMMVGISAVISLFPYYRNEFGATETEAVVWVFDVSGVTRDIVPIVVTLRPDS